MKAVEKTKTQKIINKIEQGLFDENDIDNLFMKLRAYSSGFGIFREIADYVAHNDLRDRGITNESLNGMYLSIKFFLEYTSPKKTLDISKPFPIWIKTLIKFQIDKCDETELVKMFNVKKSRLKSRINNGFKDNRKAETTEIKDGKLSSSTLEAIQYVMGFIYARESFSQSDLINQLISVINHNKFKCDEALFVNQSNKITLCILLLLHNAEFDYKGYKPGYCKISSEHSEISHNIRWVDKDNNPVDLNESFGNLDIKGHVVVKNGDKDVTVAHTVATTNLKAEDWCEEQLFNIEPKSEHTPEYLCKRLNLDQDLLISSSFKLTSAHA